MQKQVLNVFPIVLFSTLLRYNDKYKIFYLTWVKIIFFFKPGLPNIHQCISFITKILMNCDFIFYFTTQKKKVHEK